jgi:hypothetical protein
MSNPDQLAKKLMEIFFPYALRRRDGMVSKNGRFVHYTSAENALKIINTKCIWMRNTTCMSDYREVNHGLDALRRYFSDANRKRAFENALNSCGAGLANAVIADFDRWWQTTQLQTYITSISEHEDREDSHGRLSMWRAFGNSTARVAIVVKLNLNIGSNAALGAELSPVGYFTDVDFTREMDAVVSNVQNNHIFLQSVGLPRLLATAFSMLTSAAICLKHEGFEEEKEWRVIHHPARMPSPLIDSSVEVISGIPQRVYKINFKNDPASSINGFEPDEIVDRIIVGPSQFPFVTYEAFVSALTAAGVKGADKRVVVSQIPIRT